MEEIKSQFVRIINSQKLDDRFLTAQVIESSDEVENMGRLFVVLEINRPWFPISQIGSRLIQTIKRSYFSQESTSDLVNFENTIKEVNESLVRLTEQGETEWIGHLNSIILLQNEKEIHIASTGHSLAYLIREGKISQISEVDVNDPQPLKTFSSITSGTLLSEDQMILGNTGFFDVVDLARQKNDLATVSPYQMGLKFAKHIKKNKVKTVSSIIIKLAPESLIIDEPEVIYLDQSQTFVSIIVPWLKKGAVKSYETLKRFKENSQDKYVPFTKGKISLISNKAVIGAKSVWEKTQPVIVEKSKKLSQKLDSALSGIKNNQDSIDANPQESIIGKSIFTIHDYQFEKQKNTAKNLGKIINELKYYSLKIIIRFQKLYRTLKEPQKRPLVIVTSILLLIIILIFTISIKKNNQKNFASIATDQRNYDQAKQKLEDGKSALIFGDKQEAQIQFGEVINLASGIESADLKTQALGLVLSAETEYDKLTGTSRITNIDELGEFNAVDFDIIDGKGYALSPEGDIYLISLTKGSQISKIIPLPDSQRAVFVKTNLQGKLIIYTNSQDIFEFNPPDNSVNKISPSDGDHLATAITMASFGNSTYLLDPQNKQIWKYPRKDNSFQAGSKFITRSNVDLSKAVDIAIDGSLYVLSEDGKVIKLNKGEKQDFKLSSIPKPFDSITKPKKIFTDENSLSIYIFDSGARRLLEFDKNGQFLHQFILPLEYKNISNVRVLTGAKKMIFTQDNKFYGANF